MVKPGNLHSLLGGVLLLAGFLNALYLSISHYRVYADIGYSSFCAISKSINCDTVSQSSFSILFGMPVPVWGMIGYLLLFPLWLSVSKKGLNVGSGRHLMFFLIGCYCIYSMVLAFISTFYIHSYCLMCIISYATNLLLLLYAYRGVSKYSSNSFIKGLFIDLSSIGKNRKILGGVLCGAICLIVLNVYFPDYWHMEKRLESKALPTGMTDDGHHWIGAIEPELTIIEYTDYLCFQCRKMHFYLRQLLARHPEKIRLEHRHFPLDKTYNFVISDDLHKGAGEMAMLAIYAGMKGKFWEMNDFLFLFERSSKTLNFEKIGKKTGINGKELSWAIHQKSVRLILKRDIALASKDGVTGTPSYMIDGKIYLGTIPDKILKKIL